MPAKVRRRVRCRERASGLHAPYTPVRLIQAMFRALPFWSLVFLVRVSQAQAPAPPAAVPVPIPAAPSRTCVVLGPTVLAADDGRTYFGADWTMAHLVSRRWALGGTLSIGGRRAVDTAYGFQAAMPAVGLYSLAASSRYAVANTLRVRAGPGWRGNSATEPLVRWRRNSLSVNDNETEKRAATWCVLAPGSAHAAATRSRKSCEYAFMSECTAELRTLTPNML